MSIRFTVDHAAKRVDATAEGPTTCEEICNHLLLERTYHGLPYPELVEARNAIPAFTSAEVRIIVDLLRELGREDKLGPTAVIVGSELAFGMMRMLGILSEDVCAIQPFWNREEGESWLRQPG